VEKLLVANRGEIAVRVIRAARELGLRTVAVCSEADTGALHVRSADEHVVIGPAVAAKSYLDAGAVLAAARSTGADAVHPGYGFLSERAAFARAVTDAGLTWVGPSADAIDLMGDKVAALRAAIAAGVPTTPGSGGPVADVEAAIAVADRIGYPVAVKASAGGGGRGIRVVADAEELRRGLPVARAEAQAAFGSPEVYVEKFVSHARHVEVQVLGDGAGVVALGERDCSLQRKRQKVLEEAGAPNLPEAAREEMTAAAVALAQAVGYTSAGTVEFLFDPASGAVSFLEMNTRIQVEHPVTELVTGRDLVVEQLRIAAGGPLSFGQGDVAVTGAAIEARLTAEDPERGFFPSPGTLTSLRLPAGEHVRVDTGVEEGDVVSPFYDPLIAKIIVWGATREEALARMRAALDDVHVEGVATTAPMLRRLLDAPEVVAGRVWTTFLEEWLA
jgi:acetyl-CoA carboxylase biotin carboxylase subunit